MSTLIKDAAAGAGKPVLPARLGKYELLRHLATGGMADIFLARVSGIEGFEKIVVVKRILAEFVGNKEFVQLFLDEARLAATLHHPNVAQVYDVGIVGGQYFFAMEFVHGEDVRAILKTLAQQKETIPLAEALSIVQGVCAGLHYAHEKVGYDGRSLGIIHRDVSPSNVLVSYDGSVKLLDFGIAKATTRTVETRYGSIRGKVSYLSPEQCRCEALDRRSDVFSAAIVLYELTTCHKLFGGASDFEIMKRIVETPAPPPSARVKGYPLDLQKIVLKGLARDRDQRYQSAQELQLALEDFAREHKLAVSPIHLARFMESTFEEKIKAWKEAQLAGKGLGEHLITALPGKGTGTPSAPSPGVLAAGALEAEAQAEAEAHGESFQPTRADVPSEIAKRTGQSTKLPALPELAPPPKRTPLIVGGLVAAAVIAGVALALGLRSPKPAAAPPVATSATVQVESEPTGAAVFVDGRREGVTPARLPVARQRAVRLRLERDGYQPFEESLTLGANETGRLVRAALVAATPAGGRIVVKTNVKKATWKLDDRPVGDGTGQLSLADVPPGSHNLSVESEGHERRAGPVEVTPRGLASVVWDLKPTVAPGAKKPRPPKGPGKPGKPGRDIDDIGGWPPR
ncbi:MAG: serine/threonine protein kinase [Deltaproteobacteria bacterium]|nr:serine/threonine protein kinase [Deltaproteobacteria bacterium]